MMVALHFDKTFATCMNGESPQVRHDPTPPQLLCNRACRTTAAKEVQRARCACAILRREAADMIRFGWFDLWDTPVPFKDSIPKIIWFNFCNRNCVALRSLRSS